MKQIYYVIIVFIAVIVVIVIGALFIFNQKPPQDINYNTQPVDNQNKDKQSKSGVIETRVLQDLIPQTIKGNPIVIDKRASAGSALAAECKEASHLKERADYIVEAGVSSINIDQLTNTKTINLGIVAWLKGNKNTNSIQILTGVAEHGESAKLEEGSIYKIYLWELGGKLYFVCEFAGVIDLGYKDWYCHETDGGRNYLEKGTATVFSNGRVYGPYTDSCAGSILDEVVCDNDKKYILSELVLCNNSCSEGACVASTLLCGEGQKIGDVNGDGKIGGQDASLVMQIYNGNISKPVNICCADVNKDGQVTSGDSQLILNFYAGVIKEEFGVCAGSCIPKTCAQLGKTCDNWDNGCGIKLNCGTCLTGQICSNGACIVQDTNDCLSDQLKHQGFCKPKIIELNDNYANPEEYLSEYMAYGINNTASYNFNYPPLVQKTQALIQGLSTNQDKLFAIANWVYNSKYYQKGASEEGGLSTLWNNQYGVCQHAARITVAMLNKADIPALFFFIPQQTHAATIFNLDGIWGSVDTTFHKSSLNSPNQEVYIDSIENMKNKVYITLDTQGFIYNNLKLQYCNYKTMVCSEKPFNSLKIFIHPSIQTIDIFYPSEQNIIITEFNTPATKYSFSCNLKINNIVCTGAGYIYNTTDPKFDSSKYNPVFGESLIPFGYLSRYLENDEPISNIGYIHLKMPKYQTLSYEYVCVNNLENNKVIVTKTGELNVNSPIIVQWNNLEKSNESTQEEYNELINHLKSLTDDLNITP